MKYYATRADRPLRGEVRVPGDKSISHRAVLFSAMAQGTSHLTGVLDSADVRSTISAVSALGAEIEVVRETRDGLDLRVTGWGGGGPVAPAEAIECGNSGTTARLLMGVLAGWDRHVVLQGDGSLSRRPMARVTDPLVAMGAEFKSRGGLLPVSVRGGSLHPVDHVLTVASAQVKTALLLAGLRAEGCTVVTEPAPSRDHTERMLPAYGVAVGRDKDAHRAWVDGPAYLTAADVAVPADPSSAAFLVAAAVLVPGSDVAMLDIAVNPTRTGFLRVLARMGARVSVDLDDATGGEPTAVLRAHFTEDLRATTVTSEEVPSLIDEVPVLAVVATAASGTTRFEGVRELRVKESDRLMAVAEGLAALGCTVRTGEDWLEIDGPCQLGSAALDSCGDHRLAMAYAVAALVAQEPVTIDHFEAVDVSYPGFVSDLQALSVSAAL
ncbi:MAG: 3-phosphoshikimate 1-carboxyvinyltransferase [Coriobacteriia bacterium]|nr:3-phosphoshikimate 1-carboxyvinyltransferase [Coriobacteriia bacterium]